MLGTDGTCVKCNFLYDIWKIGVCMAIKLIAVDLDGTLLNSGNAISPETLRTLQVAQRMVWELKLYLLRDVLFLV